jgi:GTP-binding protein EngB required for normal cell division
MEKLAALSGYIIVLGESGSGKSSIINQIVGSSVAKSGAGEAVTTVPEQYIITAGPFQGVKLVDTPGFNDTKGLTNDEITKMIMTFIEKSGSRTLIGFILVQSCRRNRVMLREVYRSLKVAKELPNMENSCILVVTNMASYNPEDEDEREIMATIEAQMNEVKIKSGIVKWDNRRPLAGQIEDLRIAVSQLKKIELTDNHLIALGVLLACFAAATLCRIF